MPKDGPPSFQFYPREYLSSRAVVAMHPTARGGYVHLLCHAWLGDRPGWLPDDDALLAALSGLHERWAEHRESIARAWRVRKGWWVQTRMVSERRAQKRRWKRSVRGAETTNARRWDPTKRVAVRPDSDSLSVTPSFAFASSSSVEARTSLSATRTPRAESPNFVRFYETVWPRRVKRDAAWKAWLSALKRGATPSALIASGERWRAAYASAGTPEDKIMHPASWLNGGAWKDAPSPPRPDGAKGDPDVEAARARAARDLAEAEFKAQRAAWRREQEENSGGSK